MTRAEIIEQLRQECPEASDRRITDTVLNAFCKTGNQDICARARLIVSDDTFDAIEDEDEYDLTDRLDKFFDIDEIPGGGVSYIDTDEKEKRIRKASIAELDDISTGWRTASSNKPKYYYRRGKFLYLYPKPDSTIDTIHVYFVQIPEDFDDDAKTPFNQLTHLEPFHPGMVSYLKYKVKGIVGKPEDAQTAFQEYLDYIKFIKQEIGGGKSSIVYFRPKA